jgi:hypothetical protein
MIKDIQNEKAELTDDSSFGSSAIFSLKDPLLSVPPLRKVWLYRDYICLDFSIFNGPLKNLQIR